MTADSRDGFGYEPASSHVSAAQRRHYWAVAIGLQDVDGLSVSPYLRSLADDYCRGTYTLDQTGELIHNHYALAADGAPASTEPNEAPASDTNTREADLVSQRIAELLEAAPFYLAPDILPAIHRYLFQDLDPAVYAPGTFKTERMVKREKILNGDSVLYADPMAYESSLRMAFSAEAQRTYGSTLSGTALEQFCHTIAFLWQIHPFAEGNTRTVAVFSELYLRHLGFAVENDPFEHHSQYYRDALVRAMYRNAPAKILPDESYLVNFYDNVVNGATHKFDSSRLICTQLFEHPDLLRNVPPEEALMPSRPTRR